MPIRRRRANHHTYTIEPAPVPQPMTVGSLTSKPWFAMAVVGAVTLIGFYYSTQLTVTNLKEAQTAAAIKLDVQATEQKAAREKLTEVWQKNQEKNTEVLGKLETRLTVSEKTQERTDAVLSKIADQLQQLNSRSGAGRQ